MSLRPKQPVIQSSHQEADRPVPDIDRLRDQVQRKINKLEFKASTGLWSLAAFTAVSIGAYKNFYFFPPLSEKTLAFLGDAPPVQYINWAMLVYGFSAIILILSRMMSDEKPHGAVSHLGYLTAFYLFYYFADGLKDNFWAVFSGGMTILSLQSYYIWNYSHEHIRQEQEILEELNKLERDS